MADVSPLCLTFCLLGALLFLPAGQWVSGSFPKCLLGKSVAAGLFQKSSFEPGAWQGQEGEGSMEG